MTKYKLINLNEFSNNQHYLDVLDNRFIDKEELKEKINKLKYIQLKTSTHPKIKWIDKEEILKLLEE